MPEKQIYKMREDFLVGIDVGGTKTHIIDTISSNLHRFNTNDFSDMDELLATYFARVGAVPKKIIIAMAGPRDDQTGEIKMTNCPWPTFDPRKAAATYPNTTFITMHDMAAAAAGMIDAASTDLTLLKPGKAVATGTILAVTISTGVGTCIAAWDEQTKRRIFVPGEGGHMGFQPYTAAQKQHLEHIFTKYDHPSVELAVSGMFGMRHWAEHSPELRDSPELTAAIERAVATDRPIGAVLLEFATQGTGTAQTAAQTLLDHMGALVGNMLADLALVCKATGGIYLTGSVAMGLGEYWAEHTSMNTAFVRTGTPDHSPWLETLMNNIPIYLCTDPHVAASGALALAKQS